MVRHEGPGVGAGTRRFENACEELDEAIPVGIVTKDAATLDTPADDVMECVRGVDA